MITTCNVAVTDTASEIIWKGSCMKKPWVTRDVFALDDEKRDLKKSGREK